MNKRENAKQPVALATAGSPVGTGPSRAAETEEWAWMVDEDPAFYLWERGPEGQGG